MLKGERVLEICDLPLVFSFVFESFFSELGWFKSVGYLIMCVKTLRHMV